MIWDGMANADNGSGSKIDLKNLNWPTVILVLLTGGGNFLATSQNGEALRQQQYRAYSNVDDLHKAIDDFERRQLSALENQNKIMRTQGQVLENDSMLLKEIHAVVEKFDRWKAAEQNRGRPE